MHKETNQAISCSAFLMVLQKVVYVKGWCVSRGSSFCSCVIAMQVKQLYLLLLIMWRHVSSVEQEVGNTLLQVGLCRCSRIVMNVKQVA